METIRHIKTLLLRSRRVSALVILLALAVLAGVLTYTTLQLRRQIRAQIAGRDGEVLYAVALQNYAEDVEDGLADSISEPGGQLNIVLKSAELRGVLGVRLFDPNGRFVESFPPYVIERALAPENLPQLRRHHPVSRFRPSVRTAELFYPETAQPPTNTIPLLEVDVPLHTQNGPLAGIAQFLVEGQSIAAEYTRLDHRLAWQAFSAFAAGSLILTVALLWAFGRLRRAHRLLADRTEDLALANQELALAARTSALGAVTAHLIHGLKNPLAGLQEYVSSRGTGHPQDGKEDWSQAVASTRRMQAMINQVIGVLREQQAGASYEVTPGELEQIVRGRVQPLARESGVNFATVIQSQVALPNRVANLAALVMVNLVENAIQVTPRGKTVSLTVRETDEKLVFEVRDEGSGFPADTPLFMPCRSTKEGGTGIGLALCKQLANHLAAELELASSTSAGCVFTLKLPDPRGGTSSTTARLPRENRVAD